MSDCKKCGDQTGIYSYDNQHGSSSDCGCETTVTYDNKCGSTIAGETQNHCSPDCPPSDLFAKLDAEFIVPNCDSDGPAMITNVKLAVGSVLFTESIGRFTVLATDGNIYRLKNECGDDQKVGPGDSVPKDTCFAVGVPSVSNNSFNNTTDVFLCGCFITPDVNETEKIKVTRFGSIVVGSLISIQNRIYLVTQKEGTDTLYIKNEGEGGVANEQICSEDCDGNKTVFIDVIGGNDTCVDGTAKIAMDYLKGCDGGEEAIMEGQFENNIPVWDAENNKWVLGLIPESEECTTLLTCLQIDSTNPVDATYLIEVEDPQIFVDAAANQPANASDLVITICGDLFSYKGQGTGNFIRVAPFTVPTEDKKYDIGCPVCIPDCCSQCVPDLDVSETPIFPVPGELIATTTQIPYDENAGTNGVDFYFLTVDPGDNSLLLKDPTNLLPIIEFEICNPNACNMYVEMEINIASSVVLPTGVHVNQDFLLTATHTGLDINGQPSTFQYSSQQPNYESWTGPVVAIPEVVGEPFLYGEAIAGAKGRDPRSAMTKDFAYIEPFQCISFKAFLKQVLDVEVGAGAGNFTYEFAARTIIRKYVL